MKIIEDQTNMVKTQNELLVKQHLEIISQIKQLSTIQSELAQQVVNQHEDMENLYKVLGLKKDLSYYSFNMMDAQEH